LRRRGSNALRVPNEIQPVSRVQIEHRQGSVSSNALARSLKRVRRVEILGPEFCLVSPGCVRWRREAAREKLSSSAKTMAELRRRKSNLTHGAKTPVETSEPYSFNRCQCPNVELADALFRHGIVSFHLFIGLICTNISQVEMDLSFALWSCHDRHEKSPPRGVTMDTIHAARFPHEQESSSDNVLNLKEAACRPALPSENPCDLWHRAHKIPAVSRGEAVALL